MIYFLIIIKLDLLIIFTTATILILSPKLKLENKIFFDNDK